MIDVLIATGKGFLVILALMTMLVSITVSCGFTIPYGAKKNWPLYRIICIVIDVLVFSYWIGVNFR